MNWIAWGESDKLQAALHGEQRDCDGSCGRIHPDVFRSAAEFIVARLGPSGQIENAAALITDLAVDRQARADAGRRIPE